MVQGPVFLARLGQDENAEFLRRRSKKESVETWDTIKRLSYNLLWQHSGRQGTICYNSERSPQPAVAFFSCVFSSSQAEMHYNSTLLQSTENMLFPNIFILKVKKFCYIFHSKLLAAILSFAKQTILCIIIRRLLPPHHTYSYFTFYLFYCTC